MKEKIIEFLAPYIVTRKTKNENIFGVQEEAGIHLLSGCSLMITDKESCEFEDGKLIDYGNHDCIISITKDCKYEHYSYNQYDWDYISEYAILIIVDGQGSVISYLSMETFQIHKQ